MRKKLNSIILYLDWKIGTEFINNLHYSLYFRKLFIFGVFVQHISSSCFIALFYVWLKTNRPHLPETFIIILNFLLRIVTSRSVSISMLCLILLNIIFLTIATYIDTQMQQSDQVTSIIKKKYLKRLIRYHVHRKLIKVTRVFNIYFRLRCIIFITQSGYLTISHIIIIQLHEHSYKSS